MMQALTDSQLERIKALHQAIAEMQADNARLTALLDEIDDTDTDTDDMEEGN